MDRESIRRLEDRIKKQTGSVPVRYLHVDVKSQRMHLISGSGVERSFVVSTGRNGIGGREGSGQTPPGIHRIVQKIGDGAPPGRIFRDRNDTGVDWLPGRTGDNLILTRILRLEGLEEGINRGPGIDSFERYIYIHGTNQERLLGTPMSHGCICMNNGDIVSLFDSVKEGTVVIID